jgi:hypothetical protein
MEAFRRQRQKVAPQNHPDIQKVAPHDIQKVAPKPTKSLTYESKYKPTTKKGAAAKRRLHKSSRVLKEKGKKEKSLQEKREEKTKTPRILH